MNIANRLTILRMCLIPVFILLMLSVDQSPILQLGSLSLPTTQFWAGIVFVFASLTDFLDGYLARRLDLVTSFGVFFDPMADKLLVIAALVTLVGQQQIASWIVIVIISRELLVTGLRVLLARSDGEVMAAAWPGKIKTTTQMLAIICYLFNHFNLQLLNWPIGDWFLMICLFFTVYSGIEYFYHGRFVFKDNLD